EFCANGGTLVAAGHLRGIEDRAVTKTGSEWKPRLEANHAFLDPKGTQHWGRVFPTSNIDTDSEERRPLARFPVQFCQAIEVLSGKAADVKSRGTLVGAIEVQSNAVGRRAGERQG